MQRRLFLSLLFAVTTSWVAGQNRLTSPNGKIGVKVAMHLPAQELKLWYDTPAKIWEEALPLGNSRLGAMVYGNPAEEEIQLNEETLWGGSPHRNDNPKAAGALAEVQELIFRKAYREADKRNQRDLLRRAPWHALPDCRQPDASF